MPYSTLPLRIELVRHSWLPCLDEVIMCGDPKVPGVFPNFSSVSPTLFSEDFDRISDPEQFEIRGDPMTVVQKVWDNFSWTQESMFQVRTHNWILIEICAVVLQVLEDHNSICEGVGKYSQGYYNDAAVVALESFLSEVSAIKIGGKPTAQGKPLVLKQLLRSSTSDKHRGAPWTGLRSATAKLFKSDPRFRIGGEGEYDQLDFRSQYSARYGVIINSFRALLSALSGDTIANGQTRTRSMLPGRANNLGMHGIEVDTNNFTNVVLWADISSREALLGRSKAEMVRIRRLHNFNEKAVRYNFVQTGRPRYTPKTTEGVVWTKRGDDDWQNVQWPVVNACRALYSPGFTPHLSKGVSEWSALSVRSDTQAIDTTQWQVPTDELVAHVIGKMVAAIGARPDQDTEDQVLTLPPGEGGDAAVTTSLPDIASPSTEGRKRKRRRAPGPEEPAVAPDAGRLPEGRVESVASPRKRSRRPGGSRGAAILAGAEATESAKSSGGAIVLVGLAIVAAVAAFS